MSIADHTLELLKAIRADTAELRNEMVSIGLRMRGIEQHQAGFAIDLMALRSDLSHVKSDVGLIKRRLELVDA